MNKVCRNFFSFFSVLILANTYRPTVSLPFFSLESCHAWYLQVHRSILLVLTLYNSSYRRIYALDKRAVIIEALLALKYLGFLYDISHLLSISLNCHLNVQLLKSNLILNIRIFFQIENRN